MENRYLRNVGPSLWDGANALHHPGNVRAVVSDADSVEQVNHYYPFGILMGESRGGDVQRRKFGGKELDREWGLDLFDFEARRFDGMRFTQPDPLAEKYPDTSPYAFCLNNPLRNIDQHGDSVCVLLAYNGASSLSSEAATYGHMAILIQNEQGKWALWSKNGTNQSSGSYGESPDSGEHTDDEGTQLFDSPRDFLSTPDNLNAGTGQYTEGYVIPTTKEQDRKAEAKFREMLKSKYMVLDLGLTDWGGVNCAGSVQRTLKAIGLNPGFTGRNSIFQIEPRDIYKNIKSRNKAGYVVKPKRK